MFPRFNPVFGSGMTQNAQTYADLLRLPKTPTFGYRPPVVNQPGVSPVSPSVTSQTGLLGGGSDYSGGDASAGADRGETGPESAESAGLSGEVSGRGAVQGFLGAVSPVSPTAYAMNTAIDAIMGQDPYGGLSFGQAAIDAAMGQMDAQAAENDSQGGMGGSVGGNADGNDTGGGPSGGDGAGDAGDGNGWKKGGKIRNVRGLLDDPRKQDPKAKTVRGLLDGPGTGTSDSIPAVNVKTGENIKVSSGEYVVPEKVVKKLGKKYFDNLLKEHG